MKTLNLYITLFISTLLASCAQKSATQQYFREFSGPSIKQLGLKKVTPTEVMTLNIPSYVSKSKEGRRRWSAKLKAEKIVTLGSSHYYREGKVDINEVRETAASIGASITHIDMVYKGKAKKTISVPVSHTPGRTISSTSNTFGTVNTNSSSSGSIGSTPYYSNSYGSGSYSGTTNNSTYIPSSTTYAARQVAYDQYEIMIFFSTLESSISPTGIELLKQNRIIGEALSRSE